MTKAEVAKAKERCEKATEGPWWWQDWLTYGDPNTGPNKQTLVAPKTDPTMNTEEYIVGFEQEPESESDCEFIAHSRTDLPAALDMLARCMRILEEYNKGFPTSEAGEFLREWEGRETTGE